MSFSAVFTLLYFTWIITFICFIVTLTVIIGLYWVSILALMAPPPTWHALSTRPLRAVIVQNPPSSPDWPMGEQHPPQRGLFTPCARAARWDSNGTPGPPPPGGIKASRCLPARIKGSGLIGSLHHGSVRGTQAPNLPTGLLRPGSVLLQQRGQSVRLRAAGGRAAL